MKAPKSPTVDRMLEAFYLRQDKRHKRGYLGMSQIGHECKRKTYLDYRLATQKEFPAVTLAKFEDGHLSEEITAERLRQTPGIEISTENDDGEQWGFIDLGGHFRGHIDGYITGTAQLGDKVCIWENKCIADKDFEKLARLIEKKGQDSALFLWSPIYHAQAQLYMHYSGIFNHFLTVASAGSRQYLEIMTTYDPGCAIQYIQNARDIIFAVEIPARINTKEVFPCTFCGSSKICFKQAAPQPGCRSCIFAEPALTPRNDGAWICHKKQMTLSLDDQISGCDQHLYLPEMLSGFATNIDHDGESVTYERHKTFEQFVNGNKTDQLSSWEIYKLQERAANEASS